MRIIHLSDVHIHNLRDHELYKSIFKKLYKQIIELKPDLIINTGDTLNNKVSLSPESYELAGSFLSKLSNICPTYTILGNHDCIISNLQRLDAITPIKKLINNQNFHFLKDSGIYKINEEFNFCLHSVFDKEFKDLAIDESKINIGLYHGIVRSENTQEKYQLIGIPLELFSKYDYTFLGDVHTTNFLVDKEGKVRYPGSLIQQNFGESEKKGFLLWDIKNKENFTCEFVEVKNDKPYITIRVNKDIRNYNFENISQDSKVRFINESTLDNTKFRKLAYGIKNKYKLKNITIIDQDKVQDLRKIDEDTTVDNLHDINVHEKLLKNYFKNEKQEVLDKLLGYNKLYFSKLQNLEDNKINKWKITNFKWSNLFNYGKDNSIDFENLNGIVGIFGKNRSGKSSIIDSVLFTMFNKISKNVKSNYEYINSSKNEASGELTLKINNDIYNITRKLEKNSKNKSSTNLQLKINGKVNNDISRIETDKLIQKNFGTLEDFLLTSVSSQFGSNNFIEEGSTKRKEILANFLELEIFDKLYESAKDDFSFIKSSIKKLESKNFVNLIKDCKTSIDFLSEEKVKTELEIDNFLKELEKIKGEYYTLSNLLENITKYDENYENNIQKIIDNLQKEIKKGEDSIEISKIRYKEHSSLLEETKALISTYNPEKDKEIIELGKKKLSNLSSISRNIDLLNVKKNELEKNCKLLDDVPCKGSLECKLLKNVKSSYEELKKVDKNIQLLLSEKEKLLKEVEDMQLDMHKNAISEHQDALGTLRKLETSFDTISHSIEKTFLLNKNRKNELNKALSDLQEYKNNEKNLEKIKKLEEIEKNKNIVEEKLTTLKNTLQKNTELFYKSSNSLERLEEERKNYNDMLDNYTIFEKYIKAVSSGGIPFTIIKNKLDIINQKLNNYLKELVEFEVIFEDSDNNLNINIKDSNGSRAINMASGAEKMISSMAIRLALLSISNLPRSNIFVLDEPGTSLDTDNLENFIKMLEMIKQDFSTVLLISHIETLKDCCDKIIDISNINGEAKVNV